MAKVLVSDQYLTNIATAIRSLKGVTTTFTPAEMATAISSIAKKSSTDLTVSGATVTAPAGYYASAASKAVASMTLPTAAVTSVTSGFTSKATIGRSTSAQYINIPTGYNAAGAYYTISATPNGSATTPATSITANPTISVDTATGKITASVSGSKSVTPTVSAGYVSAGTAGTVSVSGSVTSDLSTQAAATITPTETEQTAVAANKYTLGAVKVAAISSTYVGSGITSRSSTDLSVSGATVTVPAGYYSAQASKSVSTMTLPTSAASSATSGYTSKATIGRSTSAQYINIPAGYNSAGGYYTISATPNGSATVPSSISGTSATLSTGTNTLTLTKTVSVTPTVSAGYVSAGTAGNSSVSLTASVTTKAAETITPGTSDQTIAAGTYLTGAQTISGDANLTAANIKEGVNIFGVSGTFDGGGEYLRTTIIPLQTTTPDSSRKYVLSGYNGGLIDGEHYLVTYDDVEWFTTCEILWESNLLLGEVSLYFDVGDHIYPFAIGSDNVGCEVVSDDTNQHTIKVEHIQFVTSGTVIQTYYTGSSAPSASLGSDGDLYLQT